MNTLSGIKPDGRFALSHDLHIDLQWVTMFGSLSAGRAWIETWNSEQKMRRFPSLSAGRVWIETEAERDRNEVDSIAIR